MPSIAICRTPSFSSAFAHFLANAVSAIPNGFGSMRRNSSENKSWLGGPCSRGMNVHKNASLSAAKSAMSTQVCPPYRLDKSEIVGISTNSWRVALPVLESSTPLIDRLNFFIAYLFALPGAAAASASGE